jgi:hypothetical protein
MVAIVVLVGIALRQDQRIKLLMHEMEEAWVTWSGSCSDVQRALLLRSWYFSGKQPATSHPDPVQDQVAEHLCEYIEDLREG